jgi:hypothetical protein
LKGVPIAYTIELRDKGLNGFLLPESELIDTFSENMKGLKELVRDVRNITRFSEFVKVTNAPLMMETTFSFQKTKEEYSLTTTSDVKTTESTQENSEDHQTTKNTSNSDLNRFSFILLLFIVL